ncbi:MAG: cyclase family protein [Armatimonadetes bacterium]|nr:cyclase family protein [Armatimonadota bacterium]MDW8121607.1 cyclase family protein [Armatimonadota bacterium]
MRLWVSFLLLIFLGIGFLLSQPRIETWRIIDLTHTLSPGIPVWPGNPPFELKNLARHDQGYYANAFSCAEHTGTHIDAPVHFISQQRYASDIPALNLVGEARVIDIRRAVSKNPDYALTSRDVLDHEARFGTIPPRSFVIARTGWEERWSRPKDYVNQDEGGVMHFPGFSPDAIALLLTRGINGVGIDTLSIDPGPSKDFAAHKVLLKAGKIAIENLTNLRELPPRGASLIVGALKIREGSGAPARVFALIRQ